MHVRSIPMCKCEMVHCLYGLFWGLICCTGTVLLAMFWGVTNLFWVWIAFVLSMVLMFGV